VTISARQLQHSDSCVILLVLRGCCVSRVLRTECVQFCMPCRLTPLVFGASLCHACHLRPGLYHHCIVRA
jgi:hypothetical protein